MGNVTLFNLANNLLTEIPSDTLAHMPKLRTLTLGGNRIHQLSNDAFEDLHNLKSLVLSDNEITEVGSKTFPPKLQRLAIARNKITTVNGSLRDLSDLEWLFIEQNALTSLDGELPASSKLVHLNATHNLLTSVPEDLYLQSAMDKLLLSHNEISALSGSIKKLRRLNHLSLTYNQIDSLNEDEFLECEKLQYLYLGHNKITELNGALRPLRAVVRVSLHHNLLTEFDLSQVRGLKTLQELDLRYNRINRLLSRVEMQNVVESLDSPNLNELRLGHNELSTLDGFLLGLRSLQNLDLSHNRLRHLPPDELVGLDNLKFLDISHNQISTLADTSKKLLPSLENLLAGHNDLKVLDNDLHGFPKICFVDLSHNKITTIGNAVAAKSSCLHKDVIATLRIFLQGNEIECTQELAIAKEINEGYRSEFVGVPECEKFALPPVVPSAAPTLVVSPPLASIPEILEVKKLEVAEETVKRQPFMDELNEAAYLAEPISERENDERPGGTVLQMGPLLQALVASSTPPAE
ncbi:leucine-rich repeat protein SHOC-2 isoform X2 [Neocloeon triangulifer]|nr:leucine-rich repeat protein SHOC-2 isoform X2 [Neocloeon triangulifer]